MAKELSIIIPVYNEEKILEENTIKLAEFMDKTKIDYEILIYSNGSKGSVCSFFVTAPNVGGLPLRNSSTIAKTTVATCVPINTPSPVSSVKRR